MQIFVDMDGVLADFDTGYEIAFGIRPSKADDTVDWNMVREREGFYRDLPPMPDMGTLWSFVAPFHPIILTGVPSSVAEAPENKRAWARKNIGYDVEVRCCKSSHKCMHAVPGDILIDDWEKYMHLWIGAGGRWVTHKSASETISRLQELGTL